MGANGLRMRHTPAAPAVVAALATTVLVSTVLIAILTGEVSPPDNAYGSLTGTTRSAPAAAHEWDFVLRSPGAVQILRHRPGLTPIDIVSTHAFGWEGLTVREALRSPKLVSVLRHRPGLTPLDLVRMESE